MRSAMQEPVIDELFTGHASKFTVEEAQCVAREFFGVDGRVTTLTSERDQNFKVIDDSGKSHVLKVTHPAESPLVTDFQTRAQVHLLKSSLGLPIPKITLNLNGDAITWYQSEKHAKRAVRMIEFLPGRPLNALPVTSEIRAGVGAGLARFDIALEGFSHRQSNHHLMWDIQHALSLKHLLTHIHDKAKRALAERFMERFEVHVLPQLGKFRRQVIHNDLNPCNVLVSDQEPGKVTAILDFGDMVEAPLVNDIAVACAYQMDSSANPVPSILECVRAYHQINPLTVDELSVLPDLIATRHLVTVAITEWRSQEHPENREYILRNNPQAWEALSLFSKLDFYRAKDTLAALNS